MKNLLTLGTVGKNVLFVNKKRSKQEKKWILTFGEKGARAMNELNYSTKYILSEVNAISKFYGFDDLVMDDLDLEKIMETANELLERNKDCLNSIDKELKINLIEATCPACGQTQEIDKYIQFIECICGAEFTL